MARKRRNKRSQPMPPKAVESVWEIGCQPLAIPIADLDSEAGPPELLLVVEVAEPSLVVFSGRVISSDPHNTFVQLVQQAMHEPLVGEARRPECIRVRSQLDADILRIMADTAGIELEVVPELGALDTAHGELTQALGGTEGDYRTRAKQTGEALREVGLRELFQVADRFYRQESWWLADNTELFRIEFGSGIEAQTGVSEEDDGAVKTLYGVLMGHAREAFGMAIYTSLEQIEQVYNIDVDHLEEASLVLDGEGLSEEEFEEVAMANAQALTIPCIGLTFTPEGNVSEELIAEAHELELPVAKEAAFPLVMRIGCGGMQLASPSELQDMLTSLEAVLGWEKELDKLDGNEDEDDAPMTVSLKAIAGFRPAITVRVTLIDNPFAPEGEFSEIDELDPFNNFYDDDDDDDGFRDMQTIIDQLLVNLPVLDEPSPRADSANPKGLGEKNN